MNPQIKEIDYGIAFTVFDGDNKWIEVNKNLKKYPELYKEVMNHELEHFVSDKPMDFWIDFRDAFKFKRSWNLIKFQLKHPRAFLSELPFVKDENGWSVNWYSVFSNLVLVILILLFVILGLMLF